MRAANGHPEPYGVKYWEIDNEIWSMKADDYVAVLRQFVPAMKQVDPGHQDHRVRQRTDSAARWGEGDIAVIQQAADLVDYSQRASLRESGSLCRRSGQGGELFANGLGETHSRSSKNPNLKLFMSEWNAQSTDWRTGLYAGGILNAFERSGLVTMATPALWLRHVTAPAWDNAFINFDNRSWFPAPNYVVMKLYRDHFAPQLLKVEGDAAGLSVDAAKSADGKRVVVKLVNAVRCRARCIAGVERVSARARLRCQLVAPDSLSARNTMEHPDLVRAVAGKVVAMAGTRATVSSAALVCGRSGNCIRARRPARRKSSPQLPSRTF